MYQNYVIPYSLKRFSILSKEKNIYKCVMIKFRYPPERLQDVAEVLKIKLRTVDGRSSEDEIYSFKYSINLTTLILQLLLQR